MSSPPLADNTTAHRQMVLNAGAAAAQVVVTAVLLFVVYGYAVRSLGTSLFGVWAVVAASASAASVGNMGLSAGMVKFVAKYRARNDPDRVRDVISTSLVSLGVSLGLVSLGAYYGLPFLLELVIHEPAEFDAAMEILPLAILSFWLGSAATATLSGLDGHNRIDLRAGAAILAVVLYCTLVLVLVPRNGLVGLVQAQVVQGAVLLATAWLLLRRQARGLAWIPWRWKRSVFREILGYSVGFQAISLAQILWEPASKAILTAFAGTAATGVFELANRLAFQVRNVVDAAHRTMVPTIAEVTESDPQRLRTIHRLSARVMVLTTSVLLPVLLLALPFISLVWLGNLNREFVLFGSLVASSWLLNLLTTPAYYANSGTGRIRWNVIGTYIMAASNIVLGLLLGLAWGGVGVVVGISLSLLAGNIAMSLEHNRRTGYGLANYLDRRDWMLVGVSIVCTAFALALLWTRGLNATESIVAILIAGGALVPGVMRHSALETARKALRALPWSTKGHRPAD